MAGLSLISLLFFVVSCSGCGHLFYHPDRVLHYPPQSIGFEPEVIKWRSTDKTELYGWLFKANTDKPKGMVLQFHGNAENISSHYASLVWLTLEGYDLFIFDYRGYGQSKGEPSRQGVYWDCMSAMNKALELNGRRGGQSLVFYGQSLGGASMLGAYADWPQKDKVDMLVVESSFMSFRDAAFKVAKKHWLTFLVSPLAYVLVNEEHGPVGKLGKIEKPVLVIHDKNDPVVPFELGKDLFDKLKTKKWFWELDQGLHIGAMVSSLGNNRKNLLSLMAKIKK